MVDIDTRKVSPKKSSRRESEAVRGCEGPRVGPTAAKNRPPERGPGGEIGSSKARTAIFASVGAAKDSTEARPVWLPPSSSTDLGPWTSPAITTPLDLLRRETALNSHPGQPQLLRRLQCRLNARGLEPDVPKGLEEVPDDALQIVWAEVAPKGGGRWKCYVENASR